MRIRNKELRNRWRRKEDRIKDLRKEAMAAGKSGKKVAKPAAAPKVVKAEKPAGEPKPKKAPAKKKAEAAE